MLFLLDTSNNIGYDGFEKSKNFITNVAEYFNPEVTRVGLIEFGGEAKLVVPFALNRKLEQLRSMINGMKYQSSKDHSIFSAYQKASVYLNSQQLQGAKFIILITASEHGNAAMHNAAIVSKLALESQGVRFFVVGAGEKVSQKKLVEYSSDSSYAYEAEHFDDIIGFVTKIRNSICRLAQYG